VLDEIDRLLTKCGSHKSKVPQAQIWVSDIRNRPARALVEIMVIAAK
jgi:enamine deaminase RidA (YjgF/YER057c/UK114 family)